MAQSPDVVEPEARVYRPAFGGTVRPGLGGPALPLGRDGLDDPLRLGYGELAGEPTRVFTREELLRGAWGSAPWAPRARSTRMPSACARSSTGRATGSW